MYLEIVEEQEKELLEIAFPRLPKYILGREFDADINENSALSTTMEAVKHMPVSDDYKELLYRVCEIAENYETLWQHASYHINEETVKNEDRLGIKSTCEELLKHNLERNKK